MADVRLTWEQLAKANTRLVAEVTGLRKSLADLRLAARGLVATFPETIPEGQDEVSFSTPAIKVEALRQLVTDNTSETGVIE